MIARRAVVIAGAMLLVASLAWAHDLFLKLESYFLAPGSRVQIPVLNGTFARSDATVATERIADISIQSPAGRARLDPIAAWRSRDSTSLLTLELDEAGTYVVGVTTRPRDSQRDAQNFNAFLEADGIPDVLEDRRRANELGKDARYRYAKYVKAVFQVGAARTAHFGAVLGHAAEIVPLDNPYAAGVGPSLRFRCLVGGQPVANQVVFWGGERNGLAVAERRARTDSTGVVTLPRDVGRWYLKFIHMARAAEPGLDYDSHWATLTFEVR